MRRAALAAGVLALLLGAPLEAGARDGAGDAAGQGTRDGTRAFRPEQYFAGVTRSSGVLLSAGGEPTSRFTGETRGRRERDGSVSFDQTIRFEDGATRRRTWRIVRTGETTIEATGTDIVGTARGEVNGRTLRLLSTIRLDENNPLSAVDFDQTLELQPDGRTLTNASTITVLGLVVSRVSEAFVRGERTGGEPRRK
jgi:hypothetical protein